MTAHVLLGRLCQLSGSTAKKAGCLPALAGVNQGPKAGSAAANWVCRIKLKRWFQESVLLKRSISTFLACVCVCARERVRSNGLSQTVGNLTLYVRNALLHPQSNPN